MSTRPKRKAELQRELRHLQDELDAARRELHEIKDNIRHDCDDDEAVIAPRARSRGKDERTAAPTRFFRRIEAVEQFCGLIY